MTIARHPLFIAGEWRLGAAGRSTLVSNPATEEVFAEVPDASEADVVAAIDAAQRAFADGRGAWPSMAPQARSKILHRFCDLLEAHAAELCEISRTEVGAVQMLEAVQVFMGIRQTRHWAAQAASYEFHEPQRPVLGALGGAGQSTVFKEPIGVVAAITPFNFPITLNLWKIGPALAMGNSMVLKPSPYTPLSALVLARLLAEAGLPEGVFNVVCGGPEVARVLVTHPAVAMVSFTGSDVVGRRVLVAAADTFKRVVLELGGKSALIVFADADLNDAGLAAALGAFTVHCGQGCALTTRILVEAAAHDEVVTRLQSMLSSLVIGPPSDPRSMMGPLIREAQRERVERYVQIGRDEGATLAFGGGRPAAHRRGYYVEPTLFVNVHNRMRIAQEEIFGPVGVVIPFATTDEAIALANDSRYGLAGSVWSADRARAFTVAQRIRAGFLSINGGNGELGGPIGYAPFGGYKHSGLGREHGEAGAEEFLELKTVDYPIC